MNRQHVHGFERLLGERALRFVRLLFKPDNHELDKSTHGHMRPVGHGCGRLLDLHEIRHSLFAMERRSGQIEDRQSVEHQVDGLGQRENRDGPVEPREMFV